MIKTGSPYYVTTPFVSPATGLTSTSYTLSIYVWTGLKASVPATAAYTITKPNPTASILDDEIDISGYVNDYMEFEAVKGTVTGNTALATDNNVWVKTEVTYETTNPTDGTTAQLETISLASLGYTYGNGGKNITTITNDILLSGDEFKVSRAGFFSFPILLDESLTTNVSITSFPDMEISLVDINIATTDSAELVHNSWVNLSETTTDEYVEIVFNGQTITLLIQNEQKYSPLDIFFQNKEGAQQVLTFFKERTDDLSIESKSFESFRGQPSDGKHQFIRYNVQAEESFKLNSGFVAEEMNETFTQLLLSERIWSYDGTDFTPLDIKTTKQTWKTQQKDKLINYEIEFKASYNKINNV